MGSALPRKRRNRGSCSISSGRWHWHAVIHDESNTACLHHIRTQSSFARAGTRFVFRTREMEWACRAPVLGPTPTMRAAALHNPRAVSTAWVSGQLLRARLSQSGGGFRSSKQGTSWLSLGFRASLRERNRSAAPIEAVSASTCTQLLIRPGQSQNGIGTDDQSLPMPWTELQIRRKNSRRLGFHGAELRPSCRGCVGTRQPRNCLRAGFGTPFLGDTSGLESPVKRGERRVRFLPNATRVWRGELVG